MRSKRIHLLGFVALAAACMGSGQASQAQSTDDASIFKDADLTLGRRLIEEHRCAQCHARKFGGDGRAVYRPMERLKTAGNLRGMVEQCNTELNLGLFPEEVSAVAAVLNQDHYKFK